MAGGTEAIQLSAAILRNQAPDLVLRLGSTVAARVLERHGSRGLLAIGNAVLAAQLPGELSAGDSLRLLVHEATTEKVTLKLLAPHQPPPISVTLPGGPSVRVDPDEDTDHRGQPTDHSVALTYNSPSLGSLRFQLSLGSRAVAVTVRAAPGVPLQMAQQAAGELRDALAQVTGRAARVTVLPREDPVDLYA